MVQSLAVFSVVEAKLSIELRLETSDLLAVAAVCGVNVDLPGNSVTADAVEKLSKFEDVVRQRLKVTKGNFKLTILKLTNTNLYRSKDRRLHQTNLHLTPARSDSGVTFAHS